MRRIGFGILLLVLAGGAVVGGILAQDPPLRLDNMVLQIVLASGQIDVAPGVEERDGPWGSRCAMGQGRRRARNHRGGVRCGDGARRLQGQPGAAYKLPRQLLAIEEIPRHASGKGDYRRGGEVIARLMG